jgi:uncharacterized protein YbcI
LPPSQAATGVNSRFKAPAESRKRQEATLEDSEPAVGGRLLTELSNAMVALHRDHFGRGPRAARSFFTEDLVVCVLSDVYTRVEKTLIKAGQADQVRETRLLHQLAMETEFKKPVEALTGRRVSAFVSTVHLDPDLAVEIFVLEPEKPGAAQTGDGSRRKSSTE